MVSWKLALSSEGLTNDLYELVLSYQIVTDNVAGMLLHCALNGPIRDLDIHFFKAKLS